MVKPVMVKMAEAAHLLGSRKVWVVHSNDGLDEVSVCADTQVAESSEEGVHTFEFKPLEKKIGLPEGGDRTQNATLIFPFWLDWDSKQLIIRLSSEFC